MKGIDVSSNNSSIDFAKVKASGVEVVYIKATEGISYLNPLLEKQYTNAKAAGLKVGFYHYLTSDNSVVQAQYFLKSIASYIAECKYVIDVEGNWSIEDASTATKKFTDYLIGLGKEVCIYTGDYFYRDNLDSTVKSLPLWVANYGTNILAKSYVGVQYSETGSVSGISGYVDLDTFQSGILLSTATSVLVTATANSTLKSQIMALEYYLNVDYNAKLKNVDGNVYQETLNNLEAVGKLIVKGHKSHVVQWLQQKLIKYGYLKTGQDTMIYDNNTFQAITNLQKKWGRETSGKILVSNNTWQIFLYN